MTYKPKFKDQLKNFYFYANTDKIVPKNAIKILGTYIRNDTKLDAQIGKLSGQLHNKINEIKSLTKFTNFKTRLNFLNAHVIRKLMYAIPL